MSEVKQANYSEVSDYYDKLWSELDEKKIAGINSRHRYFLRILKKAGLRKNSRVLEIGCGNGTLTAFIAKELPNGKITGVDISPETIEMAKKRHMPRFKQIDFKVSDMTNFSNPEKFDFVIFPDVLEHIPIEAHSNIFKTIRANVHENSVIVINIPYPRAVEYMHKYRPELMQIIDQALHTYPFLKAIYENDFYVEQMNTYAVFFDEPDYQSFIVKPNREIHEMHVKSKFKVILKSIYLRLENLLS